MFTRIQLLAGIALAAIWLSTTTLAQMPGGGRIVTIDLNRVFNEYYETPTASQTLKDTAEQYNRDHEELMAQYRKLVDELNKLREDQDKTEYTPEVREDKKKKVQDKLNETQRAQREIEEYRASHRRMLDEQTKRMRERILKKIKDIILRESRDAGYALVLDKSGNTANGEPSIIFAQDSMDVTDDILKVLNKNKPVEVPKVEEKKSDKPADKK